MKFLRDLLLLVLGILLGVPAALWVNNYTERGANQRAEVERSEKAKELLSLARAAMRENVKALNGEKEPLSHEQVTLGPVFHTAVWDAISLELNAKVRAPEIRMDLAEHFSQVKQWEALNDMYISYSVGLMSALRSDQPIRASVKDELLQRIDRIARGAETLDPKIEVAIKGGNP